MVARVDMHRVYPPAKAAMTRSKPFQSNRTQAVRLPK